MEQGEIRKLGTVSETYSDGSVSDISVSVFTTMEGPYLIIEDGIYKATLSIDILEKASNLYRTSLRPITRNS